MRNKKYTRAGKELFYLLATKANLRVMYAFGIRAIWGKLHMRKHWFWINGLKENWEWDCTTVQGDKRFYWIIMSPQVRKFWLRTTWMSKSVPVCLLRLLRIVMFGRLRILDSSRHCRQLIGHGYDMIYCVFSFYSFNGNEKLLASKLLETNDGARLLTYIEATQRGASRLTMFIFYFLLFGIDSHLTETNVNSWCLLKMFHLSSSTAWDLYPRF